jgi:hypothetical protein
MGYLFKGNFSFLEVPEFDENSIEFECIQRVVDIFTTFAIKHDFEGTNYEEWKPINSDENFKAYNLTKEGCEYQEIPENERFKDWVEIYKDANVDLY